MIYGVNGQKYEKVKLREQWTDYLQEQKKISQTRMKPFSRCKFNELINIFESKHIKCNALDNVIQYYIKSHNYND